MELPVENEGGRSGQVNRLAVAGPAHAHDTPVVIRIASLKFAEKRALIDGDIGTAINVRVNTNIRVWKAITANT